MQVCSVPIQPAEPALLAGSRGDLAFTGSMVDIGLLALIAAALVGFGVAALLLVRRRRAAADARRSDGRFPVVLSVGAVMAGLLFLPALAPQAAHADPANGCVALQVSDVSVNGTSGDPSTLILEPGAPPVTISATLTNLTDRSVLLAIGSKAAGDQNFAQQIQWSAARDTTSVSSVLADTAAHQLGSLAPHQRVTVRISLTLPADTDNAYQGNKLTSTFWAQATQAS